MMKLFFGLILLTIAFSNCKKTDDAIVRINCDGIITDTSGTFDTARIYMPNAFTPNTDGLNDIIRPYTKSVSSIEFTIYDDNNNVIFSTNQLGQGWGGSATASSGTLFYYKIQATTVENHRIGKCGGFFQFSCFPATHPPLFFEDQITADGFTASTIESLPVCP